MSNDTTNRRERETSGSPHLIAVPRSKINLTDHVGGDVATKQQTSAPATLMGY